MKKLLLFATLLLSFAILGSAQASYNSTTLGAAVGNLTPGQPFATSIVVASISNINYSTSAQTYLLVDSELMLVTAQPISGTLVVRVSRGQAGTRAEPHINGATVFIGSGNGYFNNFLHSSGSACTASNQLVLPWFYPNAPTGGFGKTSNCIGGQWVNGISTPYGKWRINAPEPGATAYTSINTNGTALTATTMYCTEVFLPTDKLLTGIAILNGTTVGTDNHLVILYSKAGGTALANSATAGAVSSGGSTFQQYAFTSTYIAVGPADYFACVQSNGATDNLRMVVTGVNDNLLTKGQTASVFGTIPALVAPTTFTTAVGSYIYLY